MKKRVIETAHGRIELLGTGQQAVVGGTHPSGSRYEWSGGLPTEIPTLTPEQFESLWTALSDQFSVQPVPKSTERERDPKLNGADAGVLTTIDEPTAEDLCSALAWPPLIESADDNARWSEVGYALLSLGALGRELWLGFERGGTEHKNMPGAWWELHATQTPRTDYRHIFTLARKLGWRATAEPETFPVLHDFVPGYTHVPDDVPKAYAIPQARSLTTDLMNANRLAANYGRDRLIVVNDTFRAWSGRHWQRDEGEASRSTAHLAALVRVELDAAEEKFKALSAGVAEVPPVVENKRREQSRALTELLALRNGKEIYASLLKVEELRKWVKECEMQPRLAKAHTLLRSILAADNIEMDADPALLNCESGTINLRTGAVRPHDPKDYITKLAPVPYVRDAVAPRFEKFLLEIMDGDAARVRFLQRWFGYALTGEVTEQKMLLHIGPGANGKSTLLDAIKNVFGDYAHTGAPGLLTMSSGDRHPTEIADLAGRRLVTLHESDDGAVLREGLLKQATGGDSLSGRFMHKDFFSFTPTHKIQLLTNHKPTVRGQDHAIWRRLLLVYYPVSFGSAAELEKKWVQRRGDPGLLDKLRTEREGIFAWVVRGAIDWYAGGLKPPPSVLEASEAYRAEQDRVAQFIGDCCILDPKAWSAIGGAFGLYPKYMRWCKESGYYALNRMRFLAELTRACPQLVRNDQKHTVDGVRKTMRGFSGVHVNIDDDGGGSVESNEDLI